jgi:hypothetical protein
MSRIGDSVIETLFVFAEVFPEPLRPKRLKRWNGSATNRFTPAGSTGRRPKSANSVTPARSAFVEQETCFKAKSLGYKSRTAGISC